jgi:hypothetical protein
MAALRLNTSLETLRPFCCHHTLHLHGDLCHCLHKGSPQALQAVLTVSAHHVLQNSPQFIVQRFEVCTPRKPNLGADEGQKVPSAATRELSWPFEQELSPAGRPIPDH